MKSTRAAILAAAKMCAEQGSPPNQMHVAGYHIDENNVVWLERDDGSVVAFMSKETFDSLGYTFTPDQGGK